MCSGNILSSVELTMADHVVGGSILFPGVGYAEMAFALSGAERPVLAAISFLRPCVLRPFGARHLEEPVTLVYTRRDTSAFEIASQKPGGSVGGVLTHVLGREATGPAVVQSRTFPEQNHGLRFIMQTILDLEGAVDPRTEISAGVPVPRPAAQSVTFVPAGIGAASLGTSLAVL